MTPTRYAVMCRLPAHVSDDPGQLSGVRRPLSMLLAPGRLIHTEGGTISSGPALGRLWAARCAEHHHNALWPLLLCALDSSKDDDFRPWCSGELSLRAISPPGRHDPAARLADWWEGNTQDPDEKSCSPRRTGSAGPAGRPRPR